MYLHVLSYEGPAKLSQPSYWGPRALSNGLNFEAHQRRNSAGKLIKRLGNGILQSLQEHDLWSMQMLYNDTTLKRTLHATYSCSQVACPKCRSQPGRRQVQDKHQRQSPRFARSSPCIVVPTPKLPLTMATFNAMALTSTQSPAKKTSTNVVLQ